MDKSFYVVASGTAIKALIRRGSVCVCVCVCVRLEHVHRGPKTKAKESPPRKSHPNLHYNVPTPCTKLHNQSPVWRKILKMCFGLKIKYNFKNVCLRKKIFKIKKYKILKFIRKTKF